MTNPLSSCHKAPCHVDTGEEGTSCYVCSSCSEACNPVFQYTGSTSYKKDYSNLGLNLILLAICMLILFSGVILGLVFGTARFQHICAEAQVDVITGKYKVK